MKILTTSLFIIFTSFGFSQDYIPLLQEGNKWNVDIHYDPFKGVPYVVTRELSLGDLVVINGLEYRQTLLSGNESCLLREEDGVVYKYKESQQEEVILFDFNLEIGDVFNVSDSAYSSFPFNSSCVSPDLQSWVYETELHVNDVSYVELAGQVRKVISFEEYSSVGYFYWIEGIGNWTGFDLMAETIDVSGESIISCFTNNGETYFMFGATSCDNTTLQISDVLKGEITLYPNPITETSLLQLPQGFDIDQIRIYDVTGKVFADERIDKLVHPIASKKFSSGLYLYQLYSSGNLIKTAKFIVK